MPQVAYRPKNPFEVQDAVHMSPFDVDYRRRNSSFTSMQDQLKKQKGKATSYIQPFDIGTSARVSMIPNMLPKQFKSQPELRKIPAEK